MHLPSATGIRKIPTHTPLATTLVCRLATVAEHKKLKALANEILADWDAVVACFYHPQLPATNNEAERALRLAVIARRISYGTRSNEGSARLLFGFERD